MARQACFDLDREDEYSWILAKCIERKAIVLQRFRNTVDGLISMKRFIRDQPLRTRICIRLSNDYTLKLLEYLNGIPEVEIILIYEAGFQQYKMWVSKPSQTPSVKTHFLRRIFGALCRTNDLKRRI